jgi:hypothetical protein
MLLDLMYKLEKEKIQKKKKKIRLTLAFLTWEGKFKKKKAQIMG